MRISTNFLIIAGVLAGITLLYSYYRKPAPKLIATNPPSETVLNNLQAPVLLEFDRPVQVDTISLEIIPETIHTLKQVNQNQINISFQEILDSETEYLLTIIYKDKPISQLKFTTISSQVDVKHNTQLKNELDQQYPLMGKTPLENVNYRVVYSAALTLEISLKNPNSERDVVLNAVRDWVEENGLDPSSHSYTFAN